MDAYRILGSALIDQNRLDEAITQLTTLAQKDPKAASPQTSLGVLYEMKHQPGQARAYYERALSLDPGAAVAANNPGDVDGR